MGLHPRISLVVVGLRLRTGVGRHANMVIGESLAPDKALAASVWTIGAAAGLAPRCGLGIVLRCLSAGAGRHTNLVARARFPPNVTLQAASRHLAGDADACRGRRYC